MKRLILPALCALMLTSCSGNKKQAQDSDSILEADMVAAVAAVRSATYLTADSLGPVKVGMPMAELPDSVDGLYTHKTLGQSPDAVAMDFVDNDGPQFVAYDFGEGNVDVINIVGNAVLVNAPRGSFGLGAPFSKVLELPGVETEWIGLDNGGTWYWKWQGLWFAPAQENLPDELSRRLYHSGQAPTYKDFNDQVTVGFIGTGLPF